MAWRSHGGSGVIWRISEINGGMAKMAAAWRERKLSMKSANQVWQSIIGNNGNERKWRMAAKKAMKKRESGVSGENENGVSVAMAWQKQSAMA
jgi:hypothetical protein